MKVLFDTNVILDVLLNREAFVELSSALVSLVETKAIEGYLCVTTVTTIDYLVSKTHNRHQSRLAVSKLLTLFQVADVNKEVLALASESDFTDFEDAVQHYAGQLVGVDCLVTRNLSDFKQSDYPVYTPNELWGIIELKG